MYRTRSAGLAGSIGTNVPPAFNTANNDTYITLERCNRMPTLEPGLSPCCTSK